MGLSHVIKYTLDNDLDSSPLTYQRCITWGHRHLRNLVLGVDGDDKSSFEIVKRALLLAIRSHKWRTEEVAPLYRLLRLYERGLGGLSLNYREALRRFSYFESFLENDDNLSHYDRVAAERLARTHSVFFP